MSPGRETAPGFFMESRARMRNLWRSAGSLIGNSPIVRCLYVSLFFTGTALWDLADIAATQPSVIV
jgi:hypothetical protein